MAVLKDLIVHGASRFLNGINTDAIHANLIDAQDGVFKTITTTTLDAETITTDMLNANNAGARAIFLKFFIMIISP